MVVAEEEVDDDKDEVVFAAAVLPASTELVTGTAVEDAVVADAVVMVAVIKDDEAADLADVVVVDVGDNGFVLVTDAVGFGLVGSEALTVFGVAVVPFVTAVVSATAVVVFAVTADTAVVFSVAATEAVG